RRCSAGTRSRRVLRHPLAAAGRTARLASRVMNWESLDWDALDRLRETFLTGKPGDYWRSRSDLENYDFTYGQRVAWKWNAVLAQLRRLRWTPPVAYAWGWGW